MGILLTRDGDSQAYRDAFDEAQRIIRISDEIRLSAERITENPPTTASQNSKTDDGKLSTSKLAKLHKLKTADLLQKFVNLGYLAVVDEKHELTDRGQTAGGELKRSRQFGPYFLWPRDLKVNETK